MSEGRTTERGAPSAARDPHISTRCADCLQPIGADGAGHLSWCPFWAQTDCPRLSWFGRHPLVASGE